MASTIAAVMRHLRNYFERGSIEGEITIRGGVVSPAVDAPFVCFEGSTFHDGVWQIAGNSLVGEHNPEETFTGKMWLLYPPDAFVALCEQIREYDGKNAPGALVAETLGEYSYTRATGKNGAPMTWEYAFATRLAPYRRMYTEVRG